MAIKFLIKRPTIKKAPGTTDLVSGEIAIGYSGDNPLLYYKDPLNSDSIKIVGDGYFATVTHNHDGVYQPLDSDLTAIANLTTTGIIVRTGSGTVATRAITAGSSKISITNGDGVSGNPTIDVNEAQLNINNLSGVLGTSKGGTGLSTIGSANTILGVNNSGTALEYKTISGTANQISVTNTAGAITLSLPQDIATTSTPTFAQITVSNAPTNDTHVATKAYVDNTVSSAVQGLDAKQSAKVATTGNLTYSWSGGVFTVGASAPTINGVALAIGDRVLVWQQTNKAQNGIYKLINDSGTYKLVRAEDADTWDELVGAFLAVEQGTYADTIFVCKIDAGGTLNTTDIEFVRFGSLATATAGTALELVGGTLNVRYDSTQGLDVNASNQLYVKLATSSGLAFSSGSITINKDDSLQVDGSNNLGVKLATNSGLSVVSGEGLKVNVGNGLEVSSGNIQVKAADSTINVSSSGISVNASALTINGTSNSYFYIGGTSGVYLRNNSGDLSVTDSAGTTYKSAYLSTVKLGSGSYWATLQSGILSTNSTYTLDVVSGQTSYTILTNYSTIDGGTY